MGTFFPFGFFFGCTSAGERKTGACLLQAPVVGTDKERGLDASLLLFFSFGGVAVMKRERESENLMKQSKQNWTKNNNVDENFLQRKEEEKASKFQI